MWVKIWVKYLRGSSRGNSRLTSEAQVPRSPFCFLHREDIGVSRLGGIAG